MKRRRGEIQKLIQWVPFSLCWNGIETWEGNPFSCRRGIDGRHATRRKIPRHVETWKGGLPPLTTSMRWKEADPSNYMGTLESMMRRKQKENSRRTLNTSQHLSPSAWLCRNMALYATVSYVSTRRECMSVWEVVLVNDTSNPWVKKFDPYPYPYPCIPVPLTRAGLRTRVVH